MQLFVYGKCSRQGCGSRHRKKTAEAKAETKGQNRFGNGAVITDTALILLKQKVGHEQEAYKQANKEGELTVEEVSGGALHTLLRLRGGRGVWRCSWHVWIRRCSRGGVGPQDAIDDFVDVVIIQVCLDGVAGDTQVSQPRWRVGFV